VAAPVPVDQQLVNLQTGLVDQAWAQWFRDLSGDAGAFTVTSTNITTTRTIIATVFEGDLDASHLTGNIAWAQMPAGAGAWTATPTISGALALSSTLTVAGLSTFGANVVPAVTDSYDLGTEALLWRQAFISKINATLFTLTTQTLFGGYSTIGKNAGILAAKVPSTGVTMDFGQSMIVNDFVLLRAHDLTGTIKAEYVQVGALVSGTVYNVTRDKAGIHTYDPDWPAGTPYLVLGTTGDGRIDLLAYDGKPRIVFAEQGATYNAQTVRGVVGDLNGYYGYAVDLYGAAFGAEAGENLTIDSTNGLRIRQGTTTFAQLSSSLFTVGDPSGAKMTWNGTTLAISNADLTLGGGGTWSGYVSSAALKFTRPTAYGFSQTGDVFGVYTEANGAQEYLHLDNIIKGGALFDGAARVYVTAQGWNSGAVASTTSAEILVRSEIGVSSIALTADTISASSGLFERSRTTRMGAWTTFSPTWTNLTIGNGSVQSARYTQVGNTTFVEVVVVFGSTTTVAGLITIKSLPSNNLALAVAHQLGYTVMYDSSAAQSYAGVALTSGAAQANLLGAGSPLVNTSATVPFTWATSDQLHIFLAYENT
jgi:hypothetical protein